MGAGVTIPEELDRLEARLRNYGMVDYADGEALLAEVRLLRQSLARADIVNPMLATTRKLGEKP